jgi:hypothetical protein
MTDFTSPTDSTDSNTTPLMTSLAEIKSFNPCASGWRDILKGQGKTEADDVQFPLADCVESNSISDVCWLIGKRAKEIQVCVRFARLCADSVAQLNAAASYAAASYAAAHASYAAYASDAASYAAYYAYVAAASDASQKEKNKQFLLTCIKEYRAV